jgi:hypothetical protein
MLCMPDSFNVRIFELILVATVTIIFIARVFIVSVYQNRTGDYFTNRLFFLYGQKDYDNNYRRRYVMKFANVLGIVFWVSAFVLLLCRTFEK